jgi:hypothetical protein
MDFKFKAINHPLQGEVELVLSKNDQWSDRVGDKTKKIITKELKMKNAFIKAFKLFEEFHVEMIEAAGVEVPRLKDDPRYNYL